MEVWAIFYFLHYTFWYISIFKNSDVEQKDVSTFQPIYRLQSDVNISPVALTGMCQSGLCMMKDSGFDFYADDTYSTVDKKLWDLFPDLFDWLSEAEPDDAETSSWLICIKTPYSCKSLEVTGVSQLVSTSLMLVSLQKVKLVSKIRFSTSVSSSINWFNPRHFNYFSNSGSCSD